MMGAPAGRPVREAHEAWVDVGYRFLARATAASVICRLALSRRGLRWFDDPKANGRREYGRLSVVSRGSAAYRQRKLLLRPDSLSAAHRPLTMNNGVGVAGAKVIFALAETPVSFRRPCGRPLSDPRRPGR